MLFVVMPAYFFRPAGFKWFKLTKSFFFLLHVNCRICYILAIVTNNHIEAEKAVSFSEIAKQF
jgi:hypothetical protein